MKEILKKLLKKYSFWIIMQFIIIAVNVYLLTIPSKILGQIVDLLREGASREEILSATYILLVMCILLLIARISWKMIDAKVARNVTKNLRDYLFEKMLKTDITELQSMKNGDIMSCFVRDVRQIQRFVSVDISLIARFILNFTIVAYTMTRSTNFKLTITALIPITISIILILMRIKKLHSNYEDSRKKFTDLSEFVQESTDSIRTTKAYVGEKKQYSEFLKKNKSLKSTNFELIKNETLVNVYTNLGIGIGMGISILYGSRLVLNNIISVGNFIEFNGYMLLLQAPVMWIPWVMKHFKKLQVTYNRLDKMFNLKEEEITTHEGMEKEILQGNIEIKNLTYNYPGCIEKVLENINISVEKGKSLGIIGVVGSGKTTLMNLLLKLYEVHDGCIYIDGQDINTIKTDTIRNSICYITQDNFLFSTTLKENVNLFRDEYANEEIIESTKSSMIYDEIESMSDGINTVIGEKGIDLSGGQKQRVVISRAFLSKSNIVIFDDTFSALDNRTEQHVLTNIKELTKNKTCIIVSNRISDIKHCDQIVVLEQGKIVERGTHKELLNKKEKYYEFYKNQAEKHSVNILE